MVIQKPFKHSAGLVSKSGTIVEFMHLLSASLVCTTYPCLHANVSLSLSDIVAFGAALFSKKGTSQAKKSFCCYIMSFLTLLIY